ncbi:MAG: sugar phosphate isomerase/epimerase family protein [Bacillota bacterium]
MNLMICMNGEPSDLTFLPEIADLGVGIELGSLGMVGIRSERNWEERCALHRSVRERFDGPLALHGPFLGMVYAHVDHVINEAVCRRLDMTLKAAEDLKVKRVILHSGYGPEIDIFKLQEDWLERNVSFWQREILRWADAGIEVVLENDLEPNPDMLARLVDAVDHPSLGLCLDIGHQNVFSDMCAPEWVTSWASRLHHIHLHDNDGTDDRHWSLGRGTIDFEPFYAALERHAPEVTISLEVVDKMDVKVADIRKLVARFGL